ncbi:MAG: hypothetical protein ABSF79_12825 [Smithellaceae bacterium]|jgi:hypothetical protein
MNAKNEDILVMLDSLQELFQEQGDKVTPRQPATRMEQKLHRNVHYNFASYLFTLQGFVTKSVTNKDGGYSRFIVYNPELIAEQRARVKDISAEVRKDRNED